MLNMKGAYDTMKLRLFKLLPLALSGTLLLALFLLNYTGTQASVAQAAQARILSPAIQGDLAAHDPSIIKQGNTYYVFSTNGGLEIRTSTDLVNWTRAGSVFSSIPSWVKSAVGNITNLWAPDIHYVNGTYYLYYAGSSFGSNTSVIGLATNQTLNPSASNYHWVDQGLVLQSHSTDNYNAIDPNLSFDSSNTPWLAFGSFWSGLKLRKLDSHTFKPSSTDTTIYSLAQRPSPDAIEASYIVSHGGYYYLFASVDYCCQGANSTYKIAVGRATSITGPYYSESGVRMDQGGYTVILQGSGNMRGPGGQSLYQDGSRTLLIHHYYDASANGAVKIFIRTVNWSSNGWFQLSNPIS